MNFEETDSAVQRALSARTSSFAATGTVSSPTSPICGVYDILKPILIGLENFPLFPSSWRKAIQDFVQVMDALCGPARATSASAPLNFDAIDKQVKTALISYWNNEDSHKAILAQFTATGSAGGGGNPGGGDAPPPSNPLSGIAAKICPVYKAIKPILDIVKTFIPGPWSAGIGIAEGVLDQICVSSGK
jgi:hypothetical protein